MCTKDPWNCSLLDFRLHVTPTRPLPPTPEVGVWLDLTLIKFVMKTWPYRAPSSSVQEPWEDRLFCLLSSWMLRVTSVWPCWGWLHCSGAGPEIGTCKKKAKLRQTDRDRDRPNDMVWTHRSNLSEVEISVLFPLNIYIFFCQRANFINDLV